MLQKTLQVRLKSSLEKRPQIRYAELDYLRVFLILAVFLHHVFMPFNGDGWHVMNAESSKVLDDIMVYFEQLRLPTLFFVAGAGCLLLLNKVTFWQFCRNKFHRLLIPFIVGIVLVVPPQNYYEHIQKYASIVDAYRQLAFSLDTNHLWFIEFLIVFMLLALPVYSLLKSTIGGQFLNKLEHYSAKKHGLFSLAICLGLLRCILKFVNPSQGHGIENVSVSMFFLMLFLLGMSCMSRPAIWQSIAKYRRANLVWFVLCSALFYAYYYRPDINAYTSLEVRWQIWWFLCTLLTWSGLLTLVGYANAWCKKSPKWLRGANELIYPFYILHQTVIVVLAFYIVQWDAGIVLKSLSLLLGAFLLCSAACYFLIARVGILRIVFGLKLTERVT